MFKEFTAGKTVFLVTITGELESQPELAEHLFANYPYDQGEGYYIFYLDRPMQAVE
jgi:hypothetical protein